MTYKTFAKFPRTFTLALLAVMAAPRAFAGPPGIPAPKDANKAAAKTDFKLPSTTGPLVGAPAATSAGAPVDPNAPRAPAAKPADPAKPPEPPKPPIPEAPSSKAAVPAAAELKTASDAALAQPMNEALRGNLQAAANKAAALNQAIDKDAASGKYDNKDYVKLKTALALQALSGGGAPPPESKPSSASKSSPSSPTAPAAASEAPKTSSLGSVSFTAPADVNVPSLSPISAKISNAVGLSSEVQARVEKDLLPSEVSALSNATTPPAALSQSIIAALQNSKSVAGALNALEKNPAAAALLSAAVATDDAESLGSASQSDLRKLLVAALVAKAVSDAVEKAKLDGAHPGTEAASRAEVDERGATSSPSGSSSGSDDSMSAALREISKDPNAMSQLERNLSALADSRLMSDPRLRAEFLKQVSAQIKLKRYEDDTPPMLAAAPSRKPASQEASTSFPVPLAVPAILVAVLGIVLFGVFRKRSD